MQTTTTTETTPAKKSKPAPVPMNGVDTPVLVETIFGVVKQQPQLAKFKFRARNRWVLGTHSRTRMEAFDGAGTTHTHATQIEYDADHPAVLCGADRGPTPVEFVLHALASCLMAGVANIASVRGVRLTEVEALVEGDIDLNGIFGLDASVRNGYEQLRVTFMIKGDAPPEKLREVVEQSRARSAVFDIVTKGVPVAIDVRVG